jgi:hypothetical protein
MTGCLNDESPTRGRARPSRFDVTNAKVILTGMSIHNRLAPNVSKDEREGASTRFGELFRIYLHDMGVETELLDIVDRNSEAQRHTEIPPAEWMRLRIVTALSP